MNLKTRFSVSLTLVISFLVAGLCLLIYAQVREKLFSTAKETLKEHMAHEWKHLQMHRGEVTGPSQTLRNNDIQYRILKNDRVIIDNLPSPLLRLSEAALTHEMDQIEGPEHLQLFGRYDLHSVTGYLNTLKKVLILACLLAVLLVVPLSWFFTKSLLEPFGSLADRTAELGAENLAFRFPSPPRKDEYGILVTSFNALLTRLEKSFKQIRRFATNASHELRTPLAVIRGEAEVLLRKPREISDYESGLQNIVSQSQHLQYMINRLLFLASLERMSSEPMNSSIDVKKTISSTLATLRTLHPLAAQKIELKTDGRPFYVGHRELFGSVVTNLLENAVKYSRSQIVVTARKDSEGLHLDFDDDGPGVPDAYKDVVFDPLFKAPAGGGTLGSGRTGNGLGLSIVKACVEITHGQVNLEDSPLGGLRVRVLLPETTVT